MVRETSALILTYQQLSALDILTMDYGITNRGLTKLLGKEECEEGNVYHYVTKPLLRKDILISIEGEKYPNKLLYINKTCENMKKLNEALIYLSRKTFYEKKREFNIPIRHLGYWIDKICDEIESGTIDPPRTLCEKEQEEALREYSQQLDRVKELLRNQPSIGDFVKYWKPIKYPKSKTYKRIFDKAEFIFQSDSQ